MEEIQMSEKNLLEIKDLHVNVEDKEILHGVNLEVGKDEVHVLMGPNGTGKSTLGYAITGHPKYAITSGHRKLKTKTLTIEEIRLYI